MDFALGKEKKVAIHCHAGRGRTALVICGYLMFKNEWSAQKSIEYFKERRTGSIKKEGQVKTLQNLEIFIKKM